MSRSDDQATALDLARRHLAESAAATRQAEHDRDEARQQWSIEIGLRQALGANYDALRAEVQSIADACREMSERPIGAEVPERLAHVAGPYRIAESLRAALGSTPDTGGTDG